MPQQGLHYTKNLTIDYVSTNVLPVASIIVDFIESIHSFTMDVDGRTVVDVDLMMDSIKHYTLKADEIMSKQGVNNAYFYDENPIASFSCKVLLEFEQGTVTSSENTPHEERMDVIELSKFIPQFMHSFPLISGATFNRQYSFNKPDIERGLRELILPRRSSKFIEFPYPNLDLNLVIAKELSDNLNLGFVEHQGLPYVYGLTTNSEDEIKKYIEEIIEEQFQRQRND